MWRDQDCPSGLSRLSGHLLRRQHEWRAADLPANLRRHLRQGGFCCDALHEQDPACHGRSTQHRLLPFYAAISRDSTTNAKSSFDSAASK